MAELRQCFAPLRQFRHVALAVSGGSDSIAMMHLAHAWRESLAASEPVPALSVLTVDHGLRPEARMEAEFVAAEAVGLGHPHYVLSWNTPRPVAGLQAAAREARHGLLLEWCRNHGAECLVMAHTLDDQAETFLMRLAHGSGLDGLASMSASARRDDIVLFRPLLDVTRDTLRSFLEACGLPFVDDPSNDDDRYERIRVRKKAADLAAIGLTPRALSRAAGRFRDAVGALNELTDRLIESCGELHAGGFAVMKVEALEEAPREIGRRAVERALKVVSGLKYPPRYESLVAITDAVRCRVPIDCTLAGCRLVRRRGKFVVAREWGRMDMDPRPLSQDMVWDGRMVVTFEPGLSIANMTIGPLGEDDWPPMKAMLAMTTASRLPAFIGRTLPAFRRDGQIVSVPYLGYDSAGLACKLRFVNAGFGAARQVNICDGQPF